MDEPQTPRGWYTAPDKPSSERWWTGSEWSPYEHRLPRRRETFGRGYTRAFWPGPNRAAARARIAGYFAYCPLIVAFIIAAFDRGGVPPTLYLVLAGISAIAAPFGIGFGIVGIRRAPALGAIGVSIWSIVVSAISLSLPIIIGLVLLFTLRYGH